MRSKKKILIIDDDSCNILALTAVLVSKGFDCIAADEAPAGLDLLRRDDEIGTVLMDMMIPQVDRYDAMATIEKDERIGDVKVIGVTAQARSDEAEKCLSAGAVAYVSKPVDIDILLDVLARHMS